MNTIVDDTNNNSHNPPKETGDREIFKQSNTG